MPTQPTTKWSDTTKWAEEEMNKLPPWLRDALKEEDHRASPPAQEEKQKAESAKKEG